MLLNKHTLNVKIVWRLLQCSAAVCPRGPHQEREMFAGRAMNNTYIFFYNCIS